MAVDTNGNVYVADRGNNRILLETLSSGTYTQSVLFSTGLSNPTGVAVDASGNVYIADTGNNRVLIETLAAGSYTESIVDNSTLSSPSAVAVNSSGNVFVADTGHDQVVLETLSAGSYTPTAPFTGLNAPAGVAVDASGNVYIADTGNNQVLLETLSSGSYTQSTVATGLMSPLGVAVDGAGDVYIANSGGNNVLVELPAGGGTYTQSGAGTGLLNPSGVALDVSGNVYVADSGNARVLKIQSTVNFGSVNVGSTSSVISLTFIFDTGGRIAFLSTLTQGIMSQDFQNAGTGTCITNHTYNAGDTCTVDVRFAPKYPGTRFGVAQLWSLGTFSVMAYGQTFGIGVGPQATFVPGTRSTVDAGFTSPYGIAVDVAGDVFLTDQGAGTLYEDVLSGGIYGRKAILTGHGGNIAGVAVDGAGNLYMATLSQGIFKETQQLFLGNYSETLLYNPSSTLDGVTVDQAGNVYITDFSGNRAHKLTLQFNGSYVATTFGSAFSGPTGIAVDATGNVFISNDTGGSIYKETLQPDGSYTQTTIASGFVSPESVVVDQNGNLYVGATGTNATGGTLYKLALQTDGSYIQSTIASGISRLWWIAVDQAGSLYLAQKSSPFGIASKINVSTPASLNFLSTNVGSVSSDSPQSVTLSNIGNAPLIFPVPATGSNPNVSADFTLASSGSGVCPVVSAGAGSPGSLAANTACQLPISFAPTDVGGDFGSVVLTDTTLNAAGPSYSTQTISTFGVGIALPAAQLAVPGIPATIAAGGNLGTIAVLVEDSTGKVVTTSSASVTVTITGPNSYSQMMTVAAVNGVASFNLSSLALASAGVYTVTATSSGLSSAAPTVTVTSFATVTALTATPNPITVGQSVTFTATVFPAPTGPSLGTVSFKNGSTVLGSPGPNSSGVATFSSSSLPVGANSITAAYSGNTGYTTSTSTVVTETVNAIPTSTATALTALPNPATAGQSVTLTATVAPVPTGSPLGSVNFFSGSTLLATVNVDSSGVAAFSLSSLPNGADSLTAVYSGNTGFASSTSSAVTETISPALTSTGTVLSASPNPANAGQSVTLTATVAPTPTGSSLGGVNFFNGSTSLGSGNVNSAGVASLSLTTLPTGADSLHAVYSGNTGFAASTSSVVTETINSALTSTATALTALPNPATAGQPVTLTATVSPAPTGSSLGSVDFFSGSTLFGSANINSSGVATFTLANLPTGADSLTAVYSGNTGFATSTSTAVTETVNSGSASTTIALTASPNPAMAGQPVTFTATVSPAPTGASLGTVNFNQGATLLGSASVNSSGVATFSISSLAGGADGITAVYSGNAGFGTSTSSTLTETVSPAYTVTAPATPVMVAQGGSVGIGIAVPPLGGTFNGVVVMSATGLPPGATATFNPPTVTPGSTGAPTMLTIQLLATSTTGSPTGPQQKVPLAPIAVAVALCLAAFAYRRAVPAPRMARSVLVLVSLVLAAGVLAACNGGFAGKPGTIPGNYTVTVIGTSGSLQRSTTIALVVP